MLPEDAEKMKAAAAKLKEEETNAAETSNTEIPHIAFGIFKDSKTGEWMLAKVSYDPETGNASIISRMQTGGYRQLANEKFKIEVARTLLI